LNWHPSYPEARQSAAVAKTCSKSFLGKLQRARCALPLDTRNSRQIIAQKALQLRSVAIL